MSTVLLNLRSFYVYRNVTVIYVYYGECTIAKIKFTQNQHSKAIKVSCCALFVSFSWCFSVKFSAFVVLLEANEATSA